MVTLQLWQKVPLKGVLHRGCVQPHTERGCMRVAHNPSEKGFTWGLCTTPTESGLHKSSAQHPLKLNLHRSCIQPLCNGVAQLPLKGVLHGGCT